MTVAPDLIAFAHRLADASGQVIRPLFRQRIAVTHKQGKRDFDPVTEADRGAERAICELLAQERPDDGVLGEEFGRTNPDASPISSPIADDSAATAKPTSSDTRAPYITRE